METAVPWLELPAELGSAIGKKLDTRMDVNRFRIVCSSWRSSIPPPVSEFKLTIGGVSIDECRIYLLEPPPKSPNDSRCPPPREGWLIKVAEEESGRCKVRLFNPLSRKPILFKGGTFPKALCPMDYRVTEIFVERYIVRDSESYGDESDSDEKRGRYDEWSRKVIMLPDHSWAVGEEAMFPELSKLGVLDCGKYGEDHWIGSSYWNHRYCDIIAHKGQLYAVEDFGNMWSIDHSTLEEEAVQFLPPVCGDSIGGNMKHLVESGGDLYLVDRYLESWSEERCYNSDGRRKVTDFKVYRLNQEMRKWDEIRDLGDVALFLGDHSCFSVPLKGVGGCKGNCIYFTDIEAAEVGEVQVFSMEDRSIKRVSDSPDELRILWPPPAWIAPNGFP